MDYFAMIADQIDECMPNAEKVVLPGVRHDAPIVAPDAVNAVILEFLSEHDDA